jgi:hypothetical protein
MGSFFQTPKPRNFKIEPRYWDPEKEKREARDRRIKAELGIPNEDGSYRPFIEKGEFSRGFSHGKWSVKQQRRRSNTRLLIIAIILFILIYFIMK